MSITKHLISVNSCYSACQPNATRGHQAIWWATPSTRRRRPGCLIFPVYIRKISGSYPGKEYANRFSVFFFRPYKKLWGSRRFALRPLHKAILILMLDAIAQPDSVVNKKNTRIWKLLSFVPLHKLAFILHTTNHCDTDMNTGSCTKIINCVYLYPTWWV